MTIQHNTPMTVEIVTIKDWDGAEIVRVFDSMTKAVEFCKTLSETDQINSTIHTFEVE